jgi:hypothetical protein
MAQRTDSKDPEEVVPFTADFTRRLAQIDSTETIASITAVTVTTSYGGDSSPEAMKSGAAEIATGSKKVIQMITGGTDGNEYKIKVEVKTNTNKELVIAGIVPVRSK